MATSFGGLGGLGAPMRTAAPNSNAVLAPFSEFGGSAQNWEQDWQRRYNAEAQKPTTMAETGQWVQLVPGAGPAQAGVKDALGYDGNDAAKYHQQIYDQELTRLFGDNAAQVAEFAPLDSQYGRMIMPTAYQNQTKFWDPSDIPSHQVWEVTGTAPSGGPDFGALNAERAAFGPAAESQMRQQQAFDWMQGGNQQNAVMSPDYANAGFNTVTGMSNPNAGPGQIDGVGMDWAQGVYDPATQQGTGTYQPSWQRNTNFGW